MSPATDYVQTNPFTPAFGKVPAVMAGREGIISDMIDAFEGNGSSPDLCSIFTGARGTGKTALLTYLGYRAEQAGWIVAETVAGNGMLDDLLQRIQDSAKHLADTQPGPQINSIGAARLGSISWDNSTTQPNWRTKITRILEQLETTDTGIVFSVDEVDGSLDEMIELVSVYQLLTRENRKVALLMAGLPFNVSALLSGKSTSFLRRAARHELGSIPSYEVKEALRLTVQEGGKEIEAEALNKATDAIRGFPFMFQLVGYRSWNAARESKVIDQKAVENGVEIAKEELAARVYDATYAELSKGDLEFLKAMNPGDRTTTRAEIMKRTGRTGNWASTYRRRLLEAGILLEKRQGIYAFALPGFEEYLKSQE